MTSSRQFRPLSKVNAFYRMLIVFTSLAVIAKLLGLLTTWQEVSLWIMILVFLFSGISHFTSIKYEFVKMLPPFVPLKMELIYATGLMEIVGAVLLMSPRYRAEISLALAVFLVILFPANYYAGKNNVTFRGNAHLPPLTRGAIQVLFILALLFGGGWVWL